MNTEAPEAIKRTATCPRCSGKGFVLCPKCQGTGDERNAFFVATGPCRCCQPMMTNMMKGFIACPKCEGRGTLESGRLREQDRFELPMTQSSSNPSIRPSIWS
jgi:DnaJ-class molecular chaperone